MDNAERTELSEWITQRLVAVEPPSHWEPNPDLARTRFQSRLRRHPANMRPWLIATASTFLICIVLLLTPGTKAIAQQIWRWITVGRIEIVNVDFDSLPDEAKSLSLTALNKPAPPLAVANSDEAARRAGFAPRLPRPGVLAGTPHLSVLGPMILGTIIRTADLTLALQKAGVTDEAVPKHWDGAQLAVHIGSTVTAEWNGVTLMQGLPATLSTPPGFDLGPFATAVLRAVGMNRENAQRFGRKLVSSPALLLGIPADDEVRIREVNLTTGPATMIEDIAENGQVDRVALLWSVPDRVYILSGAISTSLATAIADSVE